MRLLCGDQIEFEREHAGTPMKERPDWPFSSFDARDWAEAFVRFNQDLAAAAPDLEERMVGWFSNSLMRGFDEHASRNPARAALPEDAESAGSDYRGTAETMNLA